MEDNNYNKEKEIDNNTYDYYAAQLSDLIGLQDNITEESLEENYEISMEEYLNPTAETIEKVINTIEYIDIERRR